MIFALGTTNTPKTNAIKQSLESCPYLHGEIIDIQCYKVASGIPDMPLTLDELRTGAKNRARDVRLLNPQADYYIGMEGGVYQDSVGEEYWLTGVVYIENDL